MTPKEQRDQYYAPDGKLYQKMNNRTTLYFDGLNPLRFFSAFAIIIYHATSPIQDKFPKALKLFVHNLPIGVDMFFLVSGFLITSLLMNEKSETGSLSIRKFYLRRILRIFPLYYLIIIIAYVNYYNIYPEIDFSKFLYFAGNFWLIKINNWTVGILNPLWSLCIEEQFYLVIPFLILLIPIKHLKYLFWAIFFISIIFRAWISKTVEYNWMTIYCHILSRCDLLALGGLAAYYHFIGNFRISMHKYLFFGVLAYLILIMAIVDYNDYTTLVYATFKKMLFTIPLLLLFLGMVLNKNEDTGVLKWLKKNKVIDYLGKISFGLYMYHTLVAEYIAKFMTGHHSYLLNFALIIILTIAISTISYELFEKRIISLKKYFE